VTLMILLLPGQSRHQTLETVDRDTHLKKRYLEQNFNENSDEEVTIEVPNQVIRFMFNDCNPDEAIEISSIQINFDLSKLSKHAILNYAEV